MLIDLHLHTKNSDGIESEEELVNRLSSSQSIIVSFVDHHYLTTKVLKINSKVKIIPGMEISGTVNGNSCHFLAYSGNPKPTKNLENMLNKIRNAYDERAKRYIKQCESFGLKLPKIIRSTNLPRPIYTYDIANVIAKLRSIETDKEAISWAKSNGLLWIEEDNFFPDVYKIIQILHESNYKIFLAHPGIKFFKENISDNESMKIWKICLDAGVDGIECFYPKHTPNQTKKFIDLASKNNLLVSGGSDYHGVGRGIASPYSILPKKFADKLIASI